MSPRSSLIDTVFVLINHEVLDGFSLLRRWQRNRFLCFNETLLAMLMQADCEDCKRYSDSQEDRIERHNTDRPRIGISCI